MDRWRTKGILPHDTPEWVGSENLFLVTILCNQRNTNQLCLDGVGEGILEGIGKYHQLGRWRCFVALLMPDHLHAAVAFPEVDRMTEVVRQWKGFQTKNHNVHWRSGFHECRLRGVDAFERGSTSILENPVRAGLVENAEDWKWVWKKNEEE